MGTMGTVRVNTTQRMIFYRNFVIEESIDGWEWTHDDYNKSVGSGAGVTGLCQTVFECIDAVDDWHLNTALASVEPHGTEGVGA